MSSTQPTQPPMHTMPRVFRWPCGALILLALFSSSGCSELAVRLGFRVRLEHKPVTAVTASLKSKDGSAVSALGPGQSAQLVLVATTQDGQQYATVGAGKGKVAFDNYTITATVVQVTAGGKVSLSPDPRVSDGKVAHLRIAPVAHADVVAELDVPVRYDIPFIANYSGADGTRGFDGLPGLDGSSGTDGAMGSVDPTTGLIGPQGPGGRGSDGARGGDGGNGHDGSPGLPIHIWMRLEAASAKPLLQVKVAGGGRESLYLVDPSGGSLKVLDNGGAGGRGGLGGRGGRGGSGGQGSPPGMSGLDGQPGWDGRSGNAGAGGTIAVSIDPAAQPYLACITWSNRSGDGAPGPAPAITIEPVAALW